MYVKLFASIYQGTLRGNSHGLLVFTNLLAHADRDGIVDIHPRAIAEEVGLPSDQVRAALDVLESPDDESRSPEEQGRRIIRVDEHRAWGWRIVNYSKYRAIRSEDDRREQNRQAQERWRLKNNKSKPRKPRSAQAEAEAEASLATPVGVACPPTAYSGSPAAPKKARVIPECPVQEIVEVYHQTCPMLSRVEVMNDMRRGLVRQRWREVCIEQKFGRDEGLAWWTDYFGLVASSEFLTGRARTKPGERPFQADFEWLVRPGNFAKVVEQKYNRS